MGPYSNPKFERDPPRDLRDLENGVCTCARADALHLRHVLSSYLMGSLFTHKHWTRYAQPFARSGKRDVHVRTCRCTPPQTCVKLLSNGSLSLDTQIWTRYAQPFARSGKRGVHVRTCRCTPPQTCVKLLSNGSLFTHKIWTRSAQPFARSGKRGVHVRTCRCTPPQTCVKLLSNGSLFTHKIWTQSAQPFARYERGVCTCARADSPHLYIV